MLRCSVVLIAAWALAACGGHDRAAPQQSAKPAGAPSPAAAARAPDVRVPRGQALYARMCAVCHGAKGEGYKADRAPAVGHPELLASVSDELLLSAILEGRRATTMSAWGRARGGPLTEADARDLVAFLRSWQKLPKATLDERAPFEIGRAHV